MNTCAEARQFAGALADGELDAVPASARQHFRSCASCRREVALQGEVQRALEAALVPEYGSSRSRQGPARERAALWRPYAAAAAVLLAAGTALMASPWWRPGRPATAPSASVMMASAVRAYGSPADYTSTDPVALQSWCASHGTSMAVPAVSGEVAFGTRMTMVSGRAEVTIVYAGEGGAVEISAVPAAVSAGWPTMEARAMSGRAVGMMHRLGQTWIIVAPTEVELMRTMTDMPVGPGA